LKFFSNIPKVVARYPVLRVEYKLGIDNFATILQKSGDPGDMSTNSRLVFSDIPYYPEKEYVVKVRFILNVGIDANGNIIEMPTTESAQVIDVKSIMEKNSVINIPVPSLVARPTISSPYELTTHPHTEFKINISGFEVNGNGKKNDVSLFLLDSGDKVIHSVIEDKNNMGYFDLTKIVLDKNRLYKVKAIFKSTSGDSSDASSFEFITAGGRYVKPITKTENIVVLDDNTEDFMIEDIYLSTKFEVRLTLDGSEVYAGSTNDETKIIQKFVSLLEEGRTYLLAIKPYISHYEKPWEYLVINTVNTSDNFLPVKLPITIIKEDDQ